MKHIERRKYLDELISLRNNGMIKIITGMRRCGKSYLLFEIFTSYLESNGIAPDHIIQVDLEDYKNRVLRNPDNLYAYVESRITDGDMYYILCLRGEPHHGRGHVLYPAGRGADARPV